MSIIDPLDIEQAKAHYDEDKRIVYITYRGFLSAETSTAVYTWIQNLIDLIGIETIYGEIFDFRQVVEFLPDNLMDARNKSRRVNLTRDVQRMPVAMIVKDFYQEEILRGPMQNVPENQRKAIVKTLDEAHAFLDTWHGEHTPEES